jgi:hypothetical protein
MPKNITEEPLTVTNPNNGVTVRLLPGEDTRDTVGSVTIDGVTLPLNRFKLVQLRVCAPGIDAQLKYGDVFAVEPEQAMALLQQRSQPGNGPVVQLAPGADGAPNTAHFEPRVPDAVAQNGVKAMRIALKAAGKELPAEASPAQVSAAFAALFGDEGETKSEADDEKPEASRGRRAARGTGALASAPA